MFEDDDHKLLLSLCMQVGVQESLAAVAALEKWKVDGKEVTGCACGRGTGGLGLKRQGRGCQMLPRERRPHRQRSGRKEGKGPEWKQGSGGWWCEKSVRVPSNIHHTVLLWFNQSRKCLDWIRLQEHRCTRSHADTCAHLCCARQKYHLIKLEKKTCFQCVISWTEACICKWILWALHFM